MEIPEKTARKLNPVFLLISASVVFFLVIWIGPGNIYSSFLSASPLPLILSFPFILAACLVRVAKTSLFFSRMGIYSSVRNSAAFTFAVNFLGTVSPFRSAELTASLSVRKGNRKKTLSVIVTDRFLEMMASLVLIILSSLFVQQTLIDSYRVFLLIGALAAFFTAILVFGERFWGFRKHFRSLSPGFLSTAFLMAVLASLLEAAFLMYIFSAFGIEASFLLTVFLQHTANAIAVLASLPGGLGTREAYLIAVLSGMGFPASAAVASELMYKAVSWIIFLPAGVYSLFWLKRERN